MGPLSYLQLGFHEGVGEEVGVDSDQAGAGSDFVHAFGLSLLLATLLSPFGVTQVSDGDGGLVATFESNTMISNYGRVSSDDQKRVSSKFQLSNEGVSKVSERAHEQSKQAKRAYKSGML